jgi:hypothetical protein
MRKFITAGMAIAMLAIPAIASADVPRCEASVPVSTTVTTATFTVNQPKDTTGQFTNVWRHEYTVIVNTDGTFSGTGSIYDNGASVPTWTESISGSFDATRTHVSFQTIPVGGGATFKVTDAPMDSATVTIVDTNGTWTANVVEFLIGAPHITTDTTTTPGTESVKNHGQYVKALGGGKVPAQACAGMPLNSTQGVS